MCTMVYVGSDKPFITAHLSTEGAVGPATPANAPKALADCEHVALLASWHGGKPTCSCVFNEQSLPWEPADEKPETVAAFDLLRSLAFEHGAKLRIYGCDYDDCESEPNVSCRLAPEHIQAGMILFNIPFRGGEPPRVLIEIVPGLPKPEKPETLGVL